MKKLALSFFLILVFFIGFFPMLASTPLFKPILLGILKNRIQAESLSIKKMKFSWFGPQTFDGIDLEKSDLTANIGSLQSNVPFWKLSKLGNFFELQNGSFLFRGYGNAEITNVQAKIQNAKVLATGSTPQGGTFQVQGTIVSKNNFDITSRLKQIPTIAIDQLLGANGLLYKALGASLDLNGAMKLQSESGNLSADLSSPNSEASLNSTITKGILTLNQPFNATLKISPELSQEILQRVSPKVITRFHAKNPFTLQIFPENFSCPLRNFQLENLSIGKASLNLGQINVHSGESLHFLMKLFKDKDFSKNMDIWLTNAFFSLHEGILQLGRVDALLSNSIHICTWGNVNLNNERLHMYLGLPADTLQQSFGIQTLSRNYVLKIPVRGTLQDPEFDTGPVVAKIATMAASQQIPTKGGKIFGGLVNAFTQTQDEKDIPPPNRPFPWE